MIDYKSAVETLNLTLLGGVLPALIWLWFWLREDNVHPEPKWLLVRTFFLGAFGVIIAYFLERELYSAFRNLSFIGANFFNFGNRLALGTVIAPLVEELIKFAVVYFAVFKNKAFDEPLDAMIYLITAALGFAAMENIFFLFDTIYPTKEFGTFLLTGNLRFLGATLLHVVASATLGGAVALGFYKARQKRVWYIVVGIILAIFLHGYFNWFIINSEGKNILRIFGLLWLSTIFIILLFEKVKAIVWQPK
ncbi:MAG: PrsW family glutamic-type intramembrane protease [Patescibacteria group bacterium]